MGKDHIFSSNTSSSGGGGGTSDASAANQVTGNNSLASIDSKTPTTGQATMANSSPVVIASNQSAIPITRVLSAPTTGSITTATSVVTVTNLNDTGAVTVSVYGTYTGVNFTFEAFDTVNWVLVPAQRVDTAAIETTTGVIATTVRAWNVSPLLGFTQFRIRATAWASGTASIILQPSSQFVPIQIGIAPNAIINSIGSATAGITPGTAASQLAKAEDAVSTTGDVGVFSLGVRRDAGFIATSATGDYNEFSVNRFGAQYTAGFRTHLRTYSATANITLLASATDIFTFYGNASSTVQITKIRITGIQTTTGNVDFQLVRRSTQNTGGSTSVFSLAIHETTDGVNTSTPQYYTINATSLGTALGTIRRWYQPIAANTAGLQNEYILEFGENGKPIILSGITQGIALNLNGSTGTTVTGGILNISIEWVEF